MSYAIRGPAYADTMQAAVSLSAERYGWTWAMMQHHALVFAKRSRIVSISCVLEDLVASPRDAMGGLAKELGIAWDDALLHPSWNGKKMESVYPWGTIRTPTTEANIATMNELDAEQKAAIKGVTSIMLPHFGYESLA